MTPKIDLGTTAVEMGNDGLPQEFDVFAIRLESGAKVHVWRCHVCWHKGYSPMRSVANQSRRLHARFCRLYLLEMKPPIQIDADAEIYRLFCRQCGAVTDRCLACGACHVHERCRHGEYGILLLG